MLAEGVLKDQRGVDRGHDEHQHQHGQQAPGAAQPELAEVGLVAALTLCDEQRSNQESGDDEEDINAEESGGQPGDSGVEKDHSQRGEAADTVEASEVWQTSLTGGGFCSGDLVCLCHRRLHPEDAEV